MKYRCTKCDICNKDMTVDFIKYQAIKIKRYEHNYCNYDDFEFNKWRTLDICRECFDKIVEGIISNKKDNTDK